MTFSWNVIAKNLHANEELLARLRETIRNLESSLKHLPPDSVHLLIELERDSKQNRYTATLTLRLPRHILRSREAAGDVQRAFDRALKELKNQLQLRQPKARGDERLANPAEREEQQPQATRFAAEPHSAGRAPRNYEEVIRDFFQQHYNRLLSHISRHVQEYEWSGELPKGAVDPREIVDEVARKAEVAANQKPPDLNWLVWIFHLLHEELRRRRDAYKQKESREIPTEKPVRLPELSPKRLTPLEQIVQKEIEPQVVREEDVLPSPEMPPDEFVAQKERLEQMLPDFAHWPWEERQVFELYFLEGFEPDEIAKVTGQPLVKVQQIVDTLRARVREQFIAPEKAVI